jgi:hypothetical protein
MLYGEPAAPARLFCIALVVAGSLGFSGSRGPGARPRPTHASLRLFPAGQPQLWSLQQYVPSARGAAFDAGSASAAAPALH